MACNYLGLWSFSTNPVGLCSVIPSVPVYGDSINIGEFVFSGSPCNTSPPTDYLETGFYSNNTIIAYNIENAPNSSFPNTLLTIPRINI